MAFQPDKAQVGRPCSKPGAASGVFLDLIDSGLLLVIRNNHLDGSLLRDLHTHMLHFRFAMCDDVLFFLARFAMTPWYDVPFHKARATRQELAPEWLNKGLPISILVVEAATGILKAKRNYLLRPAFAQRFAEAISGQSETPPANWEIKIRRLYQRYNKTTLPARAGLQGNVNQI